MTAIERRSLALTSEEGSLGMNAAEESCDQAAVRES
jgi:hypothetical protein